MIMFIAEHLICTGRTLQHFDRLLRLATYKALVAADAALIRCYTRPGEGQER